MKKQTGFTIVELLIVIVVIGILAAISIVAYNGIQNRTNDAAVRSDLRNFGMKMQEYMVDNGRPVPLGVSTSPTTGEMLDTLNIKVNQNAYGAHYAVGSGYNFIYCQNGQNFAIVAGSKSGNVFAYRSTSGLVDNGAPLKTYTDTCADQGVPSFGTWGFSNGSWSAWTQ